MPANSTKDYYKILGIKKGASYQQIKKAYKEKMLLNHPDKIQGVDAKKNTQDIVEAYETLKNKDTRKQYDQNIGYGDQKQEDVSLSSFFAPMFESYKEQENNRSNFFKNKKKATNAYVYMDTYENFVGKTIPIEVIHHTGKYKVNVHIEKSDMFFLNAGRATVVSSSPEIKEEVQTHTFNEYKFEQTHLHSRKKIKLFSQSDSALKIREILLAVATGNPEMVLNLIKENPNSLLEKESFLAPCGTIFHHISALQLILFYFDWDMLNQIKGFLPSNQTVLTEQCLEMQEGGVDLVQTSFDPMALPFACLKHCFNHDYQIEHPLLENKDGIIFYNNNFYYANQETQQVTLLKPNVSKEDEQAFAALKESLISMLGESGRRTSDKEHALIERTLGHRLIRRGIHYAFNGMHYQDTRVEVNYLTAWRQYDKEYFKWGQTPMLYGITDLKDKPRDISHEIMRKIHDAWDKYRNSIRKKSDEQFLLIGLDQRKTIHILQRFCEDRPWDPIPTIQELKEEPFKRSLIYSDLTHDCNLLPLMPNEGLGFSFTLYKDKNSYYTKERANGAAAVHGPDFNQKRVVRTLAKIIEVGKSSVAEFIQEQTLVKGDEHNPVQEDLRSLNNFCSIS